MAAQTSDVDHDHLPSSNDPFPACVWECKWSDA
jgi:hypothetical protein